MIISIDTSQPMSTEDRQVLAQLIGATDWPAVSTDPRRQEDLTPREQPAKEEPKAAPAKAAPAKGKAAPKAAAKPATPPSPESAASAGSPDEAGDEEDLLGTETSAEEYTLEDAVAKATELMGAGESAKIKAALKEAGAKRVSELKGDAIATFIKAL